MASDNSVITKARREALCKATSKGSSASAINKITHIVFGDGGVDSSGNPIPPTDTQTALTHAIGTYPIDAAPTYPVSTTARYVVTIPAADLPGASISEAGLVDSAGMLCAIKTMYVKRKDAGVTFTFTFDDEF